MTLNPIGHSVGQRLTLPSAVQGHERLHSSTYNRAGVFLFHDFLQKDLAQQRFLTGCMESAAPTESFSANLNPDRDIIGTEHPLQIQAFFTRNISRCSARADQFEHRVRSIQQWWSGRNYYHPKQYRFTGEMPRRLFCEIILGDPVG
jgi:hypothetical protein